MGIIVLNCQRCGHEWIPKSYEAPKRCPRCKSEKWNEPKKQKEGMALPPQIITHDILAQDAPPSQQDQDQERREAEHPGEVGLVPHPPFARNPDGTYNPKPMFALNRRLIAEYHEKGHTAKWQQDFRIWFIESHYIAWNMPYILAPNSHTRAEIKKGITEEFHSGYDLDKLVDMLCDEACKKPEAPASQSEKPAQGSPEPQG